MYIVQIPGHLNRCYFHLICFNLPLLQRTAATASNIQQQLQDQQKKRVSSTTQKQIITFTCQQSKFNFYIEQTFFKWANGTKKKRKNEIRSNKP